MKIKMRFSFILKLENEKNKSIPVLKFIPEEAESNWNDFEIHPVFEDENGFCETVEEGKETFWSVYLHQLNGGVHCIADLPTKNDAIKFVQLLSSAFKTKLG